MSLLQISHSPDLQNLQNKGYDVEIKTRFLIISNIPYLTKTGEIKYGKICSPLNYKGNTLGKPSTHQVYFCGEFPHDKHGKPIEGIRHSSPNARITDEIIGNYHLSNKPRGGYSSYSEQIENYSRIISAPAISKDPSVTAQKFKPIRVGDENAFQYADTNCTRSNISDIQRVFEGYKVGIIGLGGTGSYILDHVSKTNVEKIKIFDADEFKQHNAFRAPGAASIDDLDKGMKKVDYFKKMYSNIHKGIEAYSENITTENVNCLKSLDFVFICIDKNSAKTVIIDFLTNNSIPFVDSGIDVRRSSQGDALRGSARITFSDGRYNKDLDTQISREDTPDNEYSSNIQISELNCLNGVLAIIEWKKHIGYYQSDLNELTRVYTTSTGTI